MHTLIIAAVTSIKQGNDNMLVFAPRDKTATTLNCELVQSRTKISLMLDSSVKYTMNGAWEKWGPPFVVMCGDTVVVNAVQTGENMFKVSEMKLLWVPVIGENLTHVSNLPRFFRWIVSSVNTGNHDVANSAVDNIAASVLDVHALDQQVWSVMSGSCRPESIPVIVQLSEKTGKSCMKIINTWFKYRIIRALQGFGLDVSMFNYYHVMIESPINVLSTIIKSSPHLVPYMSFQDAERICSIIGTPQTSEQKYAGELRRALWNNFVERNCTYMPASKFDQILMQYATHLGSNELSVIIAARDDALAKRLIVYEDTRYYLPVLYSLEAIIGMQIKMLKSMNKLSYKYQSTRREGINLTEEQISAVNLCISEPISLLTGPAGSGKSTTTAIIVSEMVECGMRVCLTSFTGKAVCRLKQICREMHVGYDRAATLDMLMVKGEHNFDAYIIDEVSMLNLTLFKTFMHRVLLPFITLQGNKYVLRDGVDAAAVPRFIFIGDHNQLPPICNGSSIDALMLSVPTITLTQVHRSSVHGISHACSSALRSEVSMSNYDDYNPYEHENAAIWKYTVNSLEQVCDMYQHLTGIYGKDEVVVLTPRRDEVFKINEILVNRETTPKHPISWVNMKIGCPVMMTKNHEKKDLVNGSIGVVKAFNYNTTTVTFNEGDSTRDVEFMNREPIGKRDKLTIKNLQVCYAFTVHKAQGSEWKAVIFYYPVGCKMLNSELFYVATSRPRECLIISSQEFTHINTMSRIKNSAHRMNTVHLRS